MFDRERLKTAAFAVIAAILTTLGISITLRPPIVPAPITISEKPSDCPKDCHKDCPCKE